MKNFSLHAILPCFLLLAFSILQASAQQAVLNRPVTVAVQDGTFSEAAGQIERQTGLMFLYKSDDIDRNRKISLNVRNRPLSEALDLLLRGTGLGYQISDRHITIGHVPARSSKPVTVTGKITDASGNPIIGANVFVQGTTNGTATGTDGMPHADVKADGLSSDIGDAPSTLHMDGAAQSGADAFDATLDSSLFAPGVMDPLADGTESLEGLLPDKEHAPFDAEGLLFTAAAPDLSDDASGLVGKGVASGDVLPPAGEEGILGTEETDVLTGTDDDDILLGGDGDEQIFGGSGDDYIDGGEGRDTIYAGDGNDIIVYDKADYLVSGGSGIDFMVSADSTLTMDTLLSGGKDGHEGPIVDSIEVLITGKDALSLTSLDQLAKDYGISGRSRRTAAMTFMAVPRKAA